MMDAQKIALEILAEAVDQGVGSGNVHAAITTAAEALNDFDQNRADEAFESLQRGDCERIRAIAIQAAQDFVQHCASRGEQPAAPQPVTGSVWATD